MTAMTQKNGAAVNGGVISYEVNENQELERLLEVATVVIAQAIDLLDNGLTSDEQISAPSKFIPGSTIGKHLRHARDHFVILANCMAQEAPRSLNYDIRLRNTPMETSRSAAKQALTEAIELLEKVVETAELNEPLTLHAITPYPQTVQTTFGRELWFGSLHAVHHWSMVRVIAGEMGIAVEDSFGFAPSTLVHKGSEAPLGKSRI